MRAPSLLPPILAAAIGREASAASLRSVCISYTQLALSELPPASLNAELPMLETALRHTLQDASSEVRQAARATFGAFASRWPARAAALKATLQASS